MNKTYKVHTSGSGIAISGSDLKNAIELNFAAIVRSAGGIGSAAGYVLDAVQAEYRRGILGGSGGVVLSIDAHGMDLAHEAVSKTPKRTEVWIYAKLEDLPTPYTFPLSSSKG